MKKIKRKKHIRIIFSLYIVFGLMLNVFPTTVLAQDNEIIQDQMQKEATSSKSAKASQVISQDTTWNDKVELSENLIVNSGLH